MQILIAPHAEEAGDEKFEVFPENRKILRLNAMSDMDLYGNEQVSSVHSAPDISLISPNARNALSPDQISSILTIILTRISQNTSSNPNRTLSLLLSRMKFKRRITMAINT